MSALPKAVQKQIAEANRLAEQITQDRLNAQAPPKEVPPPPDQGSSPDAAAAAAAAAAAGSAPPPPAPAPEGWEQKYKVLQGKYNAEVPRLQRTVGDMTSRLEQLSSQLVATQSMLASFAQNRGAAPGSQGSAPAAPAKLVKDEEVRDFGPDLIDVMRRVAREEVGPAVESRLKPVQQQVEQVRSAATQAAAAASMTEQERVFTTLDREVPDWQDQNKDGGFLDWLSQQDAYTGVVRGELLKQAYERHDAPRVVAFFKGYRTEHAVVTPPPTPAPAPAAGSQRSLEEFVAPGTSKSGATGAPNVAGKRIWTQAEIKQFYDDAAAGKFRRDVEKRNAIEKDIFAAQLEGRIR